MEQNGQNNEGQSTPAPAEQPSGYSVEQFLAEASSSPAETTTTETTSEQTETTEATPTPGSILSPKPSRDYSGLDENETSWFKSMANESYNKLLPIYKEYKTIKPEYAKLQEQIKSSTNARWYDHEQAYKLSPEVANLESQYSNLQYEEQFWQQQLAKLRGGEKANVLAIVNNQYQLGSELEPGPVAEAQVLANLQKAQIYQQNVLSNIDNYARDFGSKYKSMQAKLVEYGQKLFGKLPEPLMQKSKEVLESFPIEVRNRQEYQLLSQAAVVINALMQRLNEISRKGQVVNRTVAQGPGSYQQTPGSTGTGNEWDSFKRLLS